MNDNEIFTTIKGIVAMQPAITIKQLHFKLNQEDDVITFEGVMHLLENMESDGMLHFNQKQEISLL